MIQLKKGDRYSDKLHMPWALLRPILRILATIAFVLAFSFSLVLAGPKTPAPAVFSVDGPNVVIKGVRYANPGKPTVILWHGLVENSRIWREYGARLYEMGFDVWMPNLRGHGRDTHRTAVKNYRKGLYSFEYMVTEDIPLLVDHVIAETGQIPSLAGHSMGGMAIKEFAAGIYRTAEGALAKSDALAQTRAASKFKKLVFIGSPPHMRSLPVQTRIAGHAFKQVTKVVRSDLPMVGVDRAPTEPDPEGLLPWIRNRALSLADPVLPTVIPKGVLDADNLTREELVALREKGLSKPHTDILDDFAYWTKSKKFVARGGFAWEGPKKIYGPVLYVSGEHDALALTADMAAEARMLPMEAEPRLVVALETSHVDLVTGERAASQLVPTIAAWLGNPETLGPALSETRIGPCELRKGLLSILGRWRR